LQIVSYWPVVGDDRVKGHFDVEVLEGLRICGLKLILNEQGRYRTVAPKLGTRRTITFLPEVASQITGAAVARHKGLQPNAQH
jgi:hypothetical protein